MNNIKIIAEFDDIKINLEKDFELAVETLSHFDKLFSRDELNEILNKAIAIKKNLNTLQSQAYQEGLTTKATLNGRSLVKEYVKQSKEISKTKVIVIDMSNAYDEFHLCFENFISLPASCSFLEVVTKEVAELNDKDILDFSPEEKEQYEVGNFYSLYNKLGDSEYYFRFL